MTTRSDASNSAAKVAGVINGLANAEGKLLDDRVVPGSVSRRHARLYEPHVAELNRWAEGIAERRRRRVPWFDPESGGNRARILVLLQDPSKVAAHGSRLISRHNNDMTASNLHRTCADVGLGYDVSVNWNVVPWWVTDPMIPEAERQSFRASARSATAHLRELLALLPDLRVVVLLGKEAQSAWDLADVQFSGGRPIRAPHPGAQAYNNVDRNTGRPNSQLLHEAFAEAVRRTSR